MAIFMAELPFYTNVGILVILTKTDNPDRNGNLYYLDLVDKRGKWVGCWHSDTNAEKALDALIECTK